MKRRTERAQSQPTPGVFGLWQTAASPPKVNRCPPPLPPLATSMPQPSETRMKSMPLLAVHMLTDSQRVGSVDVT